MDSTTKISVKILTAFTDGGKGGNPAGVVLDADQLTHNQKLAIAGKVGLSETAFVSASKVAAYKLDFYTPNKQIPHCGHATIATFSYLKHLGIIKTGESSKETIDGVRAIKLQGNLAFMEQSPPRFVELTHHMDLVLNSLGLIPDDLLPGALPMIVNTGNSFLLIPVKNSGILKSIIPHHEHISTLSEDFDLIGFYVFSRDTAIPGRDASSRMFAPRYQIYEESGTGMAAGPLACYLHRILKVKQRRFLIEQGHFMAVPSPSLILVDLATVGESITGVMAGGKGMPLREIVVEIPAPGYPG